MKNHTHSNFLLQLRDVGSVSRDAELRLESPDALVQLLGHAGLHGELLLGLMMAQAQH